MNYAYDPISWTIESAYLFGDEFLVSPTMDPGATTVTVYIPPCSGNWVHLVSSILHSSVLTHLLSGVEISSLLHQLDFI